MKLRLRTFFFFFISLILFTQCSIERRLASKYVERLDSVSILYFPVNEVFVSLIDSTFIDEPITWITDYFSDSLILSLYNTAFIEELKKYEIELLFPEQSDIFLGRKEGFIVNLAQYQIEERYRTETDEEQFGDEIYYYKHPTRYVIMDFWMEVNGLNILEAYPMSFSSYYASDKVNVIFIQNQITGEVSVDNQVNPMTSNRVKELIDQSARQNAANVIDDLINRSVLKVLNSHYRTKIFHYDIETQRLKRVEFLPYTLMR